MNKFDENKIVIHKLSDKKEISHSFTHLMLELLFVIFKDAIISEFAFNIIQKIFLYSKKAFKAKY
jgi:hypothetical protein